MSSYSDLFDQVLSQFYSSFLILQDAKSDRVKQLLKETEKYLQKLGSKLRDAKALTCEMDDTRGAGVIDKNEMITDNEDETDQAKVFPFSASSYANLVLTYYFLSLFTALFGKQ